MTSKICGTLEKGQKIVLLSLNHQWVHSEETS